MLGYAGFMDCASLVILRTRSGREWGGVIGMDICENRDGRVGRCERWQGLMMGEKGRILVFDWGLGARCRARCDWMGVGSLNDSGLGQLCFRVMCWLSGRQGNVA